MKPEEFTPMAVLLAVSLFLLKEIWSFFKTKETHNESKTDKLVEAIQQNTLAVTRLTVRMELLEKRIELVPAIQNDLAKLGQKVRDMSKSK